MSISEIEKFTLYFNFYPLFKEYKYQEKAVIMKINKKQKLYRESFLSSLITSV